jgi:hypothetical protein
MDFSDAALSMPPLLRNFHYDRTDAPSSPDLSVLTVPAFKDNYLWLIHDGVHAAAVDPGDGRRSWRPCGRTA